MIDLKREEWFDCLTQCENVKTRWFCFPYGSSGSNVFRDWDKLVGNDVEIVALKLPGRGNRMQENPFSDWTSLLDTLENVFLPLLDKPFVFYGHGLGAAIAFDLVKRFQEKNIKLPLKLIISGIHCPHQNNDRLLREPALSSELLLAECWRGTTVEQINVPIMACAALSDQFVSVKEMLDWEKYTTVKFSFYEFQGDHYFIHKNQSVLVTLIANSLQPAYKVLANSLKNINNTTTKYPKNKTVAQLFEQQVMLHPDAIALICDDQKMTYQELNTRANQLAHFLIDRGVKEETVVGVCFDRSFNMIIALLAIVKAGGAYLAIDKDYPEARVSYMLRESNAVIVISENLSCKNLLISGISVINLDVEAPHINSCSSDNPITNVNSNGLVYINYTSGTSGDPKGIEILHRGVVRLVFGQNYAQFDATRVFLYQSSLIFDAATFEIWGALLHGAQCVIFTGKLSFRRLKEIITQYSITTAWLTTAVFNSVINADPTILKGLKQLLVGGETLSVPHIRKALQNLPDVEIINGYGPTESTTFITSYSVHYLARHVNTIPIGRPINNTQVYIVDENSELAESGEIYVGGAGLARGYVGLPELTKEKFVSNLKFLPANTVVYKTGDRARYLADGNLEFLGRIDDQVKIKGVRIEPSEIEMRLKNHSNIQDVKVIVTNKVSHRKKLVAYLIGHGTRPSNKELQQFLRKKLPKYMIPHYFYWIEAFPLNINGKIDRKVLTNSSILKQILPARKAHLKS